MKKRKSKQRTSTRKTAARLPTASRLVTEKMMRDLHRVLEGRDFGSVGEMNVFLNSLTGQGLQEAIQDAAPLSPKEEAQELAFDAMEAETAAQAEKLARRALEKDPDCVDALVLLAEIESNSPREIIAALEKAVAAGERSLGAEFFEENKGHFWGVLETRPYMRARLQLAELFRAEGLYPEALTHYEGLLELNPNDNQGVRDILLGCYLAIGNLDGAQRLLQHYKNDCSAVFAWGRTLERFLAGDLRNAEKELKIARKENRFVELYLSGERKIPESMPESYSLGSPEEALICVEYLAAAWAGRKEAVFWLLNQMYPAGSAR
jgi:tetratricopeptide (TPR) repeat protein